MRKEIRNFLMIIVILCAVCYALCYLSCYVFGGIVNVVMGRKYCKTPFSKSIKTKHRLSIPFGHDYCCDDDFLQQQMQHELAMQEAMNSGASFEFVGNDTRINDQFQQDLLFQQQVQTDQFMQQMQMDNQWAMDECMKASTPFEHGGYDMTWGNSFNEPSFFDSTSSFDSFSSFGGSDMGMF